MISVIVQPTDKQRFEVTWPVDHMTAACLRSSSGILPSSSSNCKTLRRSLRGGGHTNTWKALWNLFLQIFPKFHIFCSFFQFTHVLSSETGSNHLQQSIRKDSKCDEINGFDVTPPYVLLQGSPPAAPLMVWRRLLSRSGYESLTRTRRSFFNKN